MKKIRRKYKCDICKKRFHKEEMSWIWTQVDWFITCKECKVNNEVQGF